MTRHLVRRLTPALAALGLALAAPMALAQNVKLATSMGDIVIQLDDADCALDPHVPHPVARGR